MERIYGAYRSRATRVYWLALELGIEVESVPVLPGHRVPDPQAADAPLNTRSASYLTLNPAGAVPALDDNGFLLTESLAINLYLARKYGGPLAPKDEQENALMEQWSLYAATWIEPHAVILLYNPDPATSPSPEESRIAKAAEEALRRPLKLLDDHLRSSTFMVGGRFTVADINVAEIVRYTKAHPTLLGEFPALQAWLETCQARPAFREMWARRQAEGG